MTKLALLDTDFLLKAYMIKGDGDNRLIDLIVSIPEFMYICHAQVRNELARHNEKAAGWLDTQILKNKIKVYSDVLILKEMTRIYKSHIGALIRYAEHLKTACDIFEASYFENYFAEFTDLDYKTLALPKYIDMLARAEDIIKIGHNLGEIKTYILLLWHNDLAEYETYYFCSDDRKARNGIFALPNIEKIQCVSFITSFCKIRDYYCYSIKDLQLYINSAIQFFDKHKQEQIRVYE